MNQHTQIHIDEIAGQIRNVARSKKLKDMTLNKIVADYCTEGEGIYQALDLLARENKIFFLLTPGETYVIPIG